MYRGRANVQYRDGGDQLPVYGGRGPASASLPGYGQVRGEMYGRTRESKALEEAIILTTPAPDTILETEIISEGAKIRNNQRRRALPHYQRRRTKNEIFWSRFS